MNEATAVELLQAIAAQCFGFISDAEGILDHSRRVENSLDRVLQLLDEPRVAESDLACLRTAAFLHGALEKGHPESWAEARTDEDDASLARLVNEASLPEAADGHLVAEILRGFNGTAKLFPLSGKANERVGSASVPLLKPTRRLVELFAEANSLVHLEQEEIEQAADRWQGSGIPVSAPGIGCATPWAWNVSVIGNLRLTGRCALLDARTQTGWALAREGQEKTEELIERLCEAEGEPYERDVCNPAHLIDGPRQMQGDSGPTLWVDKFHGWEELTTRLRAVPLLHARNVHPYEAARVCLATVSKDQVTPIAHYALIERLEAMDELNSVLARNLGICLWDLPGLAELSRPNGEKMLIAPPITEIHGREDMDRSRRPLVGQERVLIDGLHRVWLAGRVPTQRMRVIELSNVEYLPIAFSTTWGALREYDDPPPKDCDRRWYRYETWEEYLADPRPNKVPATPRDYKYSEYRDLTLLGSPGSRLHGSSE